MAKNGKKESIMLGIFSGKCLKGVCGEITDLYDYKNEPLYIGDIVLVQYNEYGLGCHSAYMSAIVNNKFETFSDGTVLENNDYYSFVMGIANVTKKELAHENKDGELTSGWVIEKIKSYVDVVNGEHWGAFGFNYRDMKETK